MAFIGIDGKLYTSAGAPLEDFYMPPTITTAHKLLTILQRLARINGTLTFEYNEAFRAIRVRCQARSTLPGHDQYLDLAIGERELMTAGDPDDCLIYNLERLLHRIEQQAGMKWGSWVGAMDPRTRADHVNNTPFQFHNERQADPFGMGATARAVDEARKAAEQAAETIRKRDANPNIIDAEYTVVEDRPPLQAPGEVRGLPAPDPQWNEKGKQHQSPG